MFSVNPPRAKVRGREIVMIYKRTTTEAKQIKGEFESELTRLKNYLQCIEHDVTPFNSSIRETASQGIKFRREKILKDRDLVENIGFPLRRRKDTPNTYIASQVKRAIALETSARLHWTLQTGTHTGYAKEYEHILSVVSNMVMVMERSPSAFKDMKEEDLRQHFLVQLNGHYEGQATGETFNFEGKTDILIRADSKNIFIAECKFWKGSKAFRRIH